MSKLSSKASSQATAKPISKPLQELSWQQLWLNRLQLILLFAVFAAPLLGAYYVYSQRGSATFSTVNNGELYAKPQDLADITFQSPDGETQTFNAFEKKWYLLVVAEGQCGAVCEQNLLTIRQLKRMQGKNVARVVSLFVHSGLPADVTADLSAKYSVTTLSPTSNADLQTWLQPFYQARGQQQFDSSRIYIIDPLKKLMMSYPADVEPKGFHKDLKRLLKVSQIG